MLQQSAEDILCHELTRHLAIFLIFSFPWARTCDLCTIRLNGHFLIYYTIRLDGRQCAAQLGLR